MPVLVNFSDFFFPDYILREQNICRCVILQEQIHVSRCVILQKQNPSEQVYDPARTKHITTCLLSNKSKTHLNRYISQQDQNTFEQVYYSERAKHISTGMSLARAKHLNQQENKYLNRYIIQQDQNTFEQVFYPKRAETSEHVCHYQDQNI